MPSLPSLRVLLLSLLPSVVLAVILGAAAAACATSPAMRSPLRERLEKAETPAVEDATRTCLEGLGWKVDPVGSLSGGSNVVSASQKGVEPTQVYVHPPDQKPRVTGGPDDKKFWTCLASKLGGASDDEGGDGGAGGAGEGGADKGDKADKGGKGDQGDKSDKGSNDSTP